jgi:hypothetical protein
VSRSNNTNTGAAPAAAHDTRGLRFCTLLLLLPLPPPLPLLQLCLLQAGWSGRAVAGAAGCGVWRHPTATSGRDPFNLGFVAQHRDCITGERPATAKMSVPSLNQSLERCYALQGPKESAGGIRDSRIGSTFRILKGH